MTYKEEIWRKLVHLASAAFPIAYWLTDKPFMLCVLVPLAVIAIVAEALRHTRPGFRTFIDNWLGRVLRQAETHTLTGATYVTLGALLSILLFDKPIAITVLLFLSVSDALASLVGIRFGRVRLGSKSLEGSAAFFVSAAIIALLIMRSAPLVAIVGAAVATLTEALPLKVAGRKLDDNLTIPLVAGTAMTLLTKTLP
ncbi:MAG: phosphatidate cytidylyltransferase [Planctomycetes bacterium]|nr:phosphatidate cytidylyltransferase [Planctomycetota bacterium]